MLSCDFMTLQKIYVDDIIVFFNTFVEHLTYLRIIFALFRRKKINIIFIKFFLDYLFVTFLNQKINNLKIFISKNKIIAITSLRFSINLKNLDHFLDLIN